ncbi:polysaccharide pyruvyl transferase family protein [Fibrobacter sp.]|uniref:polysaccharide pyruvyl transferase family protein n=1 Tax=Fibrobacter sp. TaxID=35828 RepID=UPI0025BE57D0|nr:polysaccharide pyruvyl transferase family protein [Fibrobacter sp.]MBR3071817.1 polysaccharide pyruvyl transferase family protein [Fibrobacter sp.]
MNYLKKLLELRQIINQQLLPLIDFNYVYLELPYYENIGDTLIWEGTLRFLKQVKHKCLYSASLSTYYNHNIPKDTLILLQGGGNFGDLWERHHKFRKEIIELHPQNRVIIFPQTVWYENSENIKKDETFFAQHPNVTMCARDKVSYSFMKEHFPKNTILLVPDMAFFIDFEKYGQINNKETGKVLYAKRLDKELKTDTTPSFIPPNAEIHDWPTFEYKATKYDRADYIVGWLNFFANIKGVKPINRLIDLMRIHFYRPQYLKDCINFINQYDTIYSTRLHIAIASAMMGKTVYLMDNSYGKNSNFYDTWLTDMENVDKEIQD